MWRDLDCKDLQRDYLRNAVVRDTLARCGLLKFMQASPDVELATATRDFGGF